MYSFISSAVIETMADDPDNILTVKFNVGGKAFETARSLFRQHEDAMLARLVSDTWQADPTKPVFIDRSGTMFEFVLEYLRYGSITLPISVSKDMFLRDLDFYGILPRKGTVKTSSEAWAAQVKDRHDKSRDLETERQHIELINSIDILANHCASQYVLGFSRIFVVLADDKDKAAKKLFDAAAVSATGKYKETLQNSLSKFGLRLKEITNQGPYYTIELSLM